MVQYQKTTMKKDGLLTSNPHKRDHQTSGHAVTVSDY